jgi:hypothetical protein
MTEVLRIGAISGDEENAKHAFVVSTNSLLSGAVSVTEPRFFLHLLSFRVVLHNWPFLVGILNAFVE